MVRGCCISPCPLFAKLCNFSSKVEGNNIALHLDLCGLFRFNFFTLVFFRVRWKSQIKTQLRNLKSKVLTKLILPLALSFNSSFILLSLSILFCKMCDFKNIASRSVIACSAVYKFSQRCRAERKNCKPQKYEIYSQ